MPSIQYCNYEKLAVNLLSNTIAENINYPVNVECHFYMPTHHKCDLTNHLEAIDDILVKAKIIEDDNYKILVSHDGSRVHYDKDNPRTEITITPVGDRLESLIRQIQTELETIQSGDYPKEKKWIAMDFETSINKYWKEIK